MLVQEIEKWRPASERESYPEVQELRRQLSEADAAFIEAAGQEAFDVLSKITTSRYDEDTAHGLYRRLAGEVEARNAQVRQGFTDAERRQTLLEQTEDVARAEQIFIEKGLTAAASAIEAHDGAEQDETQNDTARGAAAQPGASVGQIQANQARAAERQSYQNELRQVQDGTINPGRMIPLGMAPEAYARHGLPDYPIKLSVKAIEKATGPHKVDMQTIEKLPELLNEPVLIYHSLSESGKFITLIDAVDKDGDPVIVIQNPVKNERGNYTNIINLYGKENFDRHIHNIIIENKLIAVDKNKATKYVSTTERQLLKATLFDDLSSQISNTSANLSSGLEENSGLLFQLTREEIHEQALQHDT
ncbi:MAG: hypothetical protein FWG89_00700 [Treponema sp.]|nr:hypothetical protein [Treponema sp.]